MGVSCVNIDWPRFPGNEIGTIKLKNVSSTCKAPRLSADIPDFTAIPGENALKCVRDAGTLLSGIIDLIDDYSAMVGSSGTRQINAASSQPHPPNPVIVIYCPDGDSSDGASTQGRLAVLDNTGRIFDETDPGQAPVEQCLMDIAQDAARTLKSLKAGLALPATGSEQTVTRDKFIITVELQEGVPDVRVMRQDVSGSQEFVNPDTIDDNLLRAIITDLAGFRPSQDHQDIPDRPGANPARLVPQATEGGFAKIVEDIITRASKDLAPEISTVSFPVAEGFFDPSSLLRQISERFLLFENLLHSIPQCEEADTEIMTGMVAGESNILLSAVKENIAVVARTSYQDTAVRLRRQYPQIDPASFGITVDETGILRIDKDLLSGSLLTGKGEAVTFVRDFGTSFHDAIRYDFNPLAGLTVKDAFAGNVNGPGGEKAMKDNCGNRREEYEKRLNELQMLLATSYELKDLFCKSKSPEEMDNGQ